MKKKLRTTDLLFALLLVLLVTLPQGAQASPAENPVQFYNTEVNATYYLAGDDSFWTVGRVYLVNDVSSYGTPEWTMTDIQGSSVSYLGAAKKSKWYCEVEIYGIASAGETTGTLTCTAGEHSNSIPVTIRVVDQPIPEEIAGPSVLSAVVGEPLIVPRPALLPAGREPDADNFEFQIWESVAFGEHATVTGWSYVGYTVTFDAPGHYVAYFNMLYANIDLVKPVAFEVSDTGGEVPGNPIMFWHTSIEKTLCLAGDRSGGIVDWVYLQEDVSAYGEPEWTIDGITGASVADLRISYSDVSHCVLEFGEIVSAGDTQATLTCSVGGYSASLPVAIHILGGSAPESVSAPPEYSGKEGEAIHVPRPGLLPEGTDISPGDFVFDLNGGDAFWAHASLSGDSQTGYDVTFDETGTYSAELGMSYLNIRLESQVVFRVADTAGNPPPQVLTESVQVNPSALALEPGDTYVLTVSFTPLAPSDTSLSWSSSDESVLAIESYHLNSCTVRAAGEGRAIVTAMALDGSGASSSCEAAVLGSAAVTGIHALSGSSLRVAWYAAAQADGFELWASRTRYSGYVLAYEGTGGSFDESGLTSGRLRYYMARAYADLGGERQYAPFGAIAVGMPFPAPASLQVTPQGNALSLKWNEVAGAFRYSLERAASAQGPYTEVYSGLETGFIDSGVLPGTLYYYRARAAAQAAGGLTFHGAYSVKKPGLVSDVPVIQSIGVASGTTLQISWSPVAGSDGYEVWRGLSANGQYKLAKDVRGTSFTNTYLKAGTIYYYKVRAYVLADGGKALGAFGPYRSGIPMAKAGTPTASPAGKGKIRLDWQPVFGATGYELWYSPTPSGTYARVYKGPSLTFTVQNLTSGKPYYFKVRGYRSIGTAIHYSPLSNYRSARLEVLDVPVIQSIGVASGTTLQISWSPVAGSDGYEVWRGLSANGQYKLAKDVRGTSFTNTYLKAGTIYYYKVRAYVLADGGKALGAFGPYRSGIPMAKAGTPTASPAGKGKIRLDWQPVFGATGYELWYSPTPSGTYARVYKGPSLTFTVQNLTSGKPYYFKVRGYRSIGTAIHYSPLSNYRSARPE